jgi:hypothetical protein
MKVTVLRAFWYGGASHSIGAEVDLPDALAREVIYGGKASAVKEQPKSAASPTPTPPIQAKQPMTTKSASALAGK